MIAKNKNKQCNECQLKNILERLWKDKANDENFIIIDEKTRMIKFIKYNLLTKN